MSEATEYFYFTSPESPYYSFTKDYLNRYGISYNANAYANGVNARDGTWLYNYYISPSGSIGTALQWDSLRNSKLNQAYVAFLKDRGLYDDSGYARVFSYDQESGGSELLNAWTQQAQAEQAALEAEQRAQEAQRQLALIESRSKQADMKASAPTAESGNTNPSSRSQNVYAKNKNLEQEPLGRIMGLAKDEDLGHAIADKLY